MGSELDPEVLAELARSEHQMGELLALPDSSAPGLRQHVLPGRFLLPTGAPGDVRR